MRRNTLRRQVHEVIYGTQTKAGRRFDIVLLWVILLSTLVVCLESVPEYRKHYLAYFQGLEWIFTLAFTMEYFLRIYSHPRPLKYIFSFYGIIDFLSFMPFYLAILSPGIRFFMTIRVLRLLRVFRILKLTSFVSNAEVIKAALLASFQKITVFILAVCTLVLLVGTLIYVVEGEEHGFTSIPQSIYWAIVTVTTVGYGDITPQTSLGQMISSVVMLLGYAIIAVPTGIVTVELSKIKHPEVPISPQLVCLHCGQPVEVKANFCSNCGHRLGSQLK
ncbi:ion transporter [Rufibacter radiotolerans]|uniref:Ion transporter n=1 Tax=Rufibacter radiotolerans TaxID=1379910 RepID=A0A0H4VI06_9BACT|nr:ion transporter [Rufibacter radiotolerans]AKQ45355.1 ion transporter [Rufibacter radiotolerans]